MNKSLSHKLVPYFFIAPTFILIFIFSYYAIFLAFKTSFQSFTMGYEASWTGLENYKSLFTDEVFLASLVHQIVLTVSTVFVNIFFPLLAAELLFFIRHQRLGEAVRTAFIVPMLVPGIVTILIWRYLYSPSFGINTIIQKLGFENFSLDWLNTPNSALWCVILVGFPFVSGLYFLIFHAGLNAIGQDIHEAAIIDGANSMNIIRSIHLPGVMPYINVVFSLTLIGSLSGFGQVAATTGGGPGYSSMIPAMYMYNVAFGDGNMGYASSMGVVMFVIIAVLTLTSRKILGSRVNKEEV